MSKNYLLQVRTNTNFAVNYQDLSLVPEVELIILFGEPVYDIDKKGQVYKSQKLSEFRCKTDTEGVAKMIGELQALQVNLQTFTNMAEGLNAIIKQNIKKKD